MTVYRIAKWESVFERAESRKLKQLTWIAMPVGLTSHGYQSLLDEFGDDAAAIYGAWCSLTAVAAGCVFRGILCSGRGIPLTLPRLSRMTGFEASLYARLEQWALRRDIGWLEVVSDDELREIIEENGGFYEENSISGESPDDPLTSRGNPPTTRHNKTVHNKTVQDTRGASVDAACVDEELHGWLVWWNTLRGNKPPLVPCGVSVDEPSKAIRKAWAIVLRDKSLQRLALDRDAIEREIRGSEFVRDAGWFRPEKVLAGKNREGEWIVKKLIEGGYRNKPKTPKESHDSRNDTAVAGRGSLFSG